MRNKIRQNISVMLCLVGLASCSGLGLRAQHNQVKSTLNRLGSIVSTVAVASSADALGIPSEGNKMLRNSDLLRLRGNDSFEFYRFLDKNLTSNYSSSNGVIEKFSTVKLQERGKIVYRKMEFNGPTGGTWWFDENDFEVYAPDRVLQIVAKNCLHYFKFGVSPFRAGLVWGYDNYVASPERPLSLDKGEQAVAVRRRLQAESANSMMNDSTAGFFVDVVTLALCWVIYRGSVCAGKKDCSEFLCCTMFPGCYLCCAPGSEGWRCCHETCCWRNQDSKRYECGLLCCGCLGFCCFMELLAGAVFLREGDARYTCNDTCCCELRVIPGKDYNRTQFRRPKTCVWYDKKNVSACKCCSWCIDCCLLKKLDNTMRDVRTSAVLTSLIETITGSMPPNIVGASSNGEKPKTKSTTGMTFADPSALRVRTESTSTGGN